MLQLFAQDSLRIAKELERSRTSYSTNLDSSLYYSNNVVEWSRAIESKWQEAWGLKMVGIYHQLKQNYDSALTYFQESKKLFELENDSLEIGKSHLSIAQMYLSKGNYDLALANNQMAKSIFEELNHTGFMNSVYDVIGQVYSLMGDHEEALPYFHKSFNIRKAQKDTFNIGINLANLTSLHNYLGNQDSVFYYANLAEPILKKTSNYFFLANTIQVMANTYKDRGEFDLAEEKYLEAINSYEEINALAGIAEATYNYAFLKDTTGDYYKAMELYESSLKHSLEAGVLKIQELSAGQLKEVYNKLGDYKRAYEMSVVHDSLRSAILDAEKQRAISELSIQFETEEKEQQIELQAAQLQAQESKLQRNQVFVIALIIIVLLMATVFLLWKNRTEKAQELERQVAEVKLREAEINAIISSQEKERNRFARDLHDGFGQLISILKLNLSHLGSKNVEDLEQRARAFEQGEAIIADMYDELRNICFDLMPQTLVKQGLQQALKEFGIRINQTHKLVCEVFVMEQKGRFTELIEVSLFRITQEWVNNVIKYANAQKITIQLTADDEELTLTIEDDGQGFDPNSFYQGKGNGWKNIQTRLNQIKGDFDLDSSPTGRGTTVSINLPLVWFKGGKSSLKEEKEYTEA